MGRLNMSAMAAKLDAETNTNYSNTEYDRLQTGKNVRRVLWPKGDNDSFYAEGYVHFGLGEDGRSVVTCPKTWGSKERCPICEYVEELQKSSDKDDKKLASDIKARRKIYINVINRDGEDDTPKVLPIGVTVLKGILEAICDPDYGDITDPDEGRDITITRKGQGLKTEYSVLPKPNSSVASDSVEFDELEEQMADLDHQFVKKSYEELEAILNCESVDDDVYEDEDDTEDDMYDSMGLSELKELCDERGIDIPVKCNRLKLITLLTKWDESDESDEEEDEPEESDDVQDAIAAALAKRRRGRK